MENDYISLKISIEEAAKIAKKLYQLEGEIFSLPGELDFNFKIKTKSKSYILKISRPDVDIDYIRFQQSILRHVANNEVQLNSPQSRPDIYGNYISEITDESGNMRKVRLLSWISGRLWSKVNPIKDELLYSLGKQAGRLTSNLQDFDHPKAHRKFEWDLAQADWTFEYTHLFNKEQQNAISKFLNKYKINQKEYLELRKGVVHNDVNDNNVIVTQDLLKPKVKAIIDYGDAIYTPIINDLAICIAYAVMHKTDALNAALPIINAYHKEFRLQEEELKFLYNLVAIRLIISVTKSAINKQNEPDNDYLLISEKPAWELLKKWTRLDEDFAHFSFRQTCGYFAHPKEREFENWAKSKMFKLSSLFPDKGFDEIHLLDLSIASTWIGHQSKFNDLEYFEYSLSRLQSQVGEKIISGGYLEPRPIYTSSAYDKSGNNGSESRSIHLGIDFWLPAETPVHALFDGIVVIAVNDKGDKEYGGLIILKHQFNSIEFYTLYGHQSISSIQNKKPGQIIKEGDCIGYIGNYPENGNWAPHLHFQIMLSLLNYTNDFPGVAYPNQMSVWKSICPNPNLLFKNEKLETQNCKNNSSLIAFRKKHLGKGLSLSYNEPLHIVRGSGVYLIDNEGRKYLDTVNNVAHVGHEHPRVIDAGLKQMAVLNTNTRYLHENINTFTKALLKTLPDELSVVHVVNSGSEATELALRMAYTYTNQKDMIAVEIGYHGNTTGCLNVSSYKFDGKGGKGTPENTHIVPLPDTYRGIYQGEKADFQYAAHIKEQIEIIQSKGRNVAGFICESIISCGGQIELPIEYLKIAYAEIRRAGGLCIADEVQVGCGRVGSKFWGFQLHNVIPDIVTIGKPIGNGHPLAAVVCTKYVADSFANGMEYFNTFGGNPVSCAIGNEVLSVINDEKLQENALSVGNYLKSELQNLQLKFPIIGDIRGQGLFLGFEIADESKVPLPEKANYLTNRMKDLGILMSTDGKDNNVLKIKPPMVFSRDNADELLSGLNSVLSEDYMKY